MTKKSILMVMMGMALLGAPMSANAQGQGVAKVLTKARQAISKAASKGGGKAASRAGATVGAAANDARAAGRVKTSKYASEAEKTKTTRTVSYECGKCDGKGKVSTWNSYYGCYQSTTCSRCFGSGRIIKTMCY